MRYFRAILREQPASCTVVVDRRLILEGRLTSAVVIVAESSIGTRSLQRPRAAAGRQARAASAWRCRLRARVIERHGGSVWSPALAEAFRPSSSSLPVRGDRSLKKPFVAIVDDDSAFASYLRTFLSLRGYETRSYSRGDEMLAAVKQGDPPDVVLLDVMMPGMNGLETLRALKTAKSDLQVIMLSGREQAATIVEAVRLGAADYVVKPDDPEGLGEIALDAAIKNAIEKTRLVTEITELRRQLSDDQDRAFLFWGDSPEMSTIASVIEQVSDSDVTVLIRGESGVGKELVARAIHQRSPRKDRPFVKVNCAALPAELLESELFGHEKGAFTGAATTRIGKFEQADTGTIFLDEIGEMKAALQAKLLHVLQDAQFTKLGSNKPINVDVRVVAATNRDLEAMMLRGEFREDLYYRLKVIEVTVPPLRERRNEISAPHQLLHGPLRAPLQPAGAAAVG